MRAKAIFTSDRVPENDGFEGFEGKSHISAKEDKKTDAEKITDKIRSSRGRDDTEERKLTKNNRNKK